MVDDRQVGFVQRRSNVRREADRGVCDALIRRVDKGGQLREADGAVPVEIPGAQQR